MPPIELGAWVSGAMFAPGAVGAAIIRFAPLLTAAGSTLQSARDNVADAVQSLKGLSTSAVTDSRIGSALNALRDHATDTDIKGVIRESAGVLKGNHWQELGDTVKSLNNLKDSLQGALANPDLSDEVRATYSQALGKIDNFVSVAQPLIEKARTLQYHW